MLPAPPPADRPEAEDVPDSGLTLVVSWDVQGQPLALWSGAGLPSDQGIAVGVATHAP